MSPIVEIDFLAALEDLEDKIRLATARLTALRAENLRLAGRIAELELDAAVAQPATMGTADEEGGAWREERREIKRRVESLARHLEEMLEDGAADE